MANKNPKNPYATLLEEAKDFANKIKFAHTKPMFFYKKEELDKGWKMSQILERVAAADQLGYDTKVSEKNGDLQFYYVKRVETPWAFRN